MSVQTDLIINGEPVPAVGGGTFDRLNPVTNELASRVAAAKSQDAIAAADAAAAAFPAWAALAPAVRRKLLLKAADDLDAAAGDFVALMKAETGSTAPWAHFNVGLAADMLREAASMTTQIGGEVIPSNKPGCFAIALREPVGVVLGIAPWNAPVILGVRAVAMPLACGNTVILKSSEISPATHHLIGKVLCDSGLPPGVVNVVSTAPEDAGEVVEALIGHPAVRRINFTGSTRVGRIVAEQAARHLKPVLLELGGKAPVIVLDDADVDAAVDATSFGAFMNQGQICMSTERAVVTPGVADEFVEKLAKKAASLPSGTGDNVVLGSMVGRDAATRVENLVKDAVGKGARLVAGGTVEGSVMTATVLDGVKSGMKIYAEESFGPVVGVVRVDNANEAVAVANDTEYGLSAALFSRDVSAAMVLARQIKSGICHINGPTVHDEPQMPFGGMKSSGYGRFGGKAAIDEFTDLRWITIETAPGQYPF